MAHHGGQAAVSCQMCEQSSQIKKKCLDCDYLLCANCCQLHKKIKELSDHQLVELNLIGTIKEGDVAKKNLKNIECRRHADQKCCLFCEDCDKVVCAACISETHNQHKMIQISEGHKLHMNKITTLRADIKRKIETLTEDMSTLDTRYSTENSKYDAEKEKILGRDKVLKEAVDKQTKNLETDLDQRWSQTNKSFKDEISQANKYKQCLESREEQLKQALESSNALDVFRTVEKEKKQKRSDLNEKPLNLKHETLPTFNTKEINLRVLNSLHGSFLENTIKENIDIQVVESYKTNSASLTSIKCNEDGTLWIYHYSQNVKDILKHEEKTENRTLTAKKKFEMSSYNIMNMAVTPWGDLLLSVGNSHLLVIPYSHQSMKKSQYSVSPLITTTAIHASSNKIIVGARDQGPLYLASGPRQIVVMDTSGKHEKVYQYDGSKRPLFTNPRRVTMDSKNNLYVLDRKSNDWGGRVITINTYTAKIIVYNGNPKVNKQENPFTPGDLVATKSDNIVVTDIDNHFLHILNSNGECIKYINTKAFGIKWPWSLDIDNRNLLHVGPNIKERINNEMAKLHVLKFTGF